MGAMYRLKAYFGMVPAEELADYADESHERYAAPRRAREQADDRWDERFEYADDDRGRDERPRDERLREDRVERPRHDEWDRRAARPVAADRGPAVSGLGAGAVRGSLAVDPASVLREPPRMAVPERVPPAAVPEQRDRGAAALARITTLQPRSYNEARTIGERYREGVPVIMNLTELDDASAKRLVDFAAGLVFALRGGFDKVTSRVFLLTPADVEVSADDARKLAERGILRQD